MNFPQPRRPQQMGNPKRNRPVVRFPVPTEPMPDIEQLEEWQSDGGCEATDGCWIEADGICEHGHQSWMLHLGLI